MDLLGTLVETLSCGAEWFDAGAMGMSLLNTSSYVSPLHGDSQWSVDVAENVVAIQSDHEVHTVELPDGERGCLNKLRQRYHSAEIPL